MTSDARGGQPSVPVHRPERLAQVDPVDWTHILSKVVLLTGWSHADADTLARAVLGRVMLAPQELHTTPSPHTGYTENEGNHGCKWAFVKPSGEAVFCHLGDWDEDGHTEDWHEGEDHEAGFRESDPRAVLMTEWNPTEEEGTTDGQ